MFRKAVLTVFLSFFTCYPGNKPIVLNNVLPHQGFFVDRIDCSFSEKPICNLLPYTNNESTNVQSLTFLMPLTSIKDECAQTVGQLRNLENKQYQCIIESVEKPIKGLQCTITYNSDVIGFEYEPSLQNNLAFKFIHKQRLKKLQDDRFNPVHRLASNNRTPHVMLDLGHGDHDTGTVNNHYNIQEKNINKEVGLKVASLLRKKGYNVFLTRTDDTFVPLNKRTTYANCDTNTDLFVSIHANAAANNNASGIETYHASTPTPTAHRLHLSSQEASAYDQLQSERLAHSKLLAHHIQNNVIAQAQRYHKDINNRHVKSASYQVLCGTEMPATLLELGFISNNKEAQMLARPEYQEKLAYGICQGLITHIEAIKAMSAIAPAKTAQEHVQAS